MNAMADSLKLMLAQSADALNRSVLAIGSTAMDDADDLPPTLPCPRDRQTDSGSWYLRDASAAKMTKIPGKNNIKLNERPTPPSKATCG